MELPIFDLVDEPESSPIKRLFCAILKSAVLDLVHSKKSVRERAVKWFKGHPALITFSTIQEVVLLSANEQKQLAKFIEGSDKPNTHFRLRLTGLHYKINE